MRYRPCLFALLVTGLGCGGDARPQRAAPTTSGVITIGSRDGLTTLSSGATVSTLDGELLPYGDGGLAIERAVVALRLQAADGTRVTTYDLATASMRWTSTGTGEVAAQAPLLALTVGPKRLLDVRHRAAATYAALFDLESGVRLGDVAIDASLIVERVAALGDAFVIIGVNRAQVVGPDGKGPVLETRGDVCVDGGRAWALGRQKLLAFDAAGATRELDISAPSGKVVACGRRGAQLVFFVSHPAEARWEVSIVGREGGAMTTFGGSGAIDERALSRVQVTRSTNAVLRDGLPPIVPLIVTEAGDAAPVLVDLEARRVTRLATPAARWKLAGVARFGEGHALVVGRWIVVLDGSGRVIAAKQVEDAIVGPPSTDGEAITWVSAEGVPRIFRSDNLDPSVTIATARDEARRELGIAPD